MVGILYHLNSFMHVSRFMIHSTSIECSDAVQCPVASSLVVQASGETQEYPVGEIAVAAVPESAREHRCSRFYEELCMGRRCSW